jgi:hypothetical protein
MRKTLAVKARATGLEPATTGSTVRYSNQLSYAPLRYHREHHQYAIKDAYPPNSALTFRYYFQGPSKVQKN